MRLQTEVVSVAACLRPNTPVVDLFCGIGGFSTGAAQAGHRVVLAVDNEPRLLSCHSSNHDCVHICCDLPADDLPLPESGRWHLHGSPPCTNLSIMQPLQSREKRAHAVDLVAWFLSLVPKHRPTTWTMEQVNTKKVREQLDLFKRRHPGLCQWVSVDMADYEVPQHRRRIIAGTPSIIAKLRRSKATRRLGLIAAIPKPPLPYVRCALYKRPNHYTREIEDVPLKDQIRSVSRPSYTILARGIKRWADADGNTLRQLSARENALIQTFPADYRIPLASVLSQLAVGNAVPPRFARLLMSPSKRPLTA